MGVESKPVWVGHSLRLRSGQALSDVFDFRLLVWVRAEAGDVPMKSAWWCSSCAIAT